MKEYKEHDLLELRNSIMNAVVEVMNKEEREEDYLNQKDFDSCYDRAKAGWEEVGKLVLPEIAASIAIHRITKHEDDFKEELRSYSVDSEGSDGDHWY